MPQAPQTGRGASRPPPPPRPLFSPLEGGPGGMTRCRRARRRGPPLPTSPLKGGRRETAAARTPLPGDGDVGEPPQNFQMRLPSPAAPIRYHAGGIGEALRSC